jgi:hypothetical protein
VKVSLDDFGTGYSSLSYLHRFPIDTLKIDRSFVSQISVDSGGAPIVAAIISMARTLRLRVVAEGVETAAQLAFLQGLSCDEAQGYYFSRPLPPAQFTEYAERRVPALIVAAPPQGHDVPSLRGERDDRIRVRRVALGASLRDSGAARRADGSTRSSIWLQRLVEGELAQMLEPWHLRGETPIPGPVDGRVVTACGIRLLGNAAGSDYPPEVSARCSSCDNISAAPRHSKIKVA